MTMTYVKFTLASGSTLLGGGTTGWTPVASDSFDQALATGFAQATSTSPAFTLPLNDSGVAVALDGVAAAGTLINVEVASYDPSGRLTSDYVLQMSFVSGDDVILSDGGATVHDVTLQATSYSSQTTAYDPVSGAAATTNKGYDFTTQKPVTAFTGSAPADPSTLTVSASTDAATYGALDTYIALTDNGGNLLNGESQADFSSLSNKASKLPASGNALGTHYTGHLFEITNVQYDLTFAQNANAVSFSYSAPPDEASPLLFKMLASKTALQQAEIIQVAATGITRQVVSDTVLNNIAVTGITYDLSETGDNRVYQFEALGATDTLSHESTHSTATTQSVTVANPSTITTGVKVASSSGDSPHYTVTVGTGSSAVTAAISSALFSVERSGDSTTLAPLTITFDTAPAATVLAALAAPYISQLTVGDTKDNGGSGTPYTFDQLIFSAVQLSGVPSVTDNGDGTSSYTFTYAIGGFRDIYTPQNPSGTLGSNVESAKWNQVKNSNGPTVLVQDAACYCTGTLILTAHGEVAVEDLQVGDLVVTFVGSSAGFKAIRWIGHRRIDLRRRYAQPENVRPIRFRAGALGDRRPHRDLVVSPGHRMRVGDELVMALELVNSATIVQESPSEVVYWHIELDQHDMILAEGVQAETYQDVGNRGAFENGTVVTLDPVLDGDVPEPCLPYAGAQAAVRDRLVACAEVLGWTRQVEPTPWLEVGNHRVEPVRDGNTYRFSLPPGCGSVRLRSRAGRPWDVDPHSGDRRQLGLKLHRLALGNGEDMKEIALDVLPTGDGFHPVEQDDDGWKWCWTNGDALLSFRRLANVQPMTVVEIACDQALPFWVAPAPTTATTLARGSGGGPMMSLH